MQKLKARRFIKNPKYLSQQQFVLMLEMQLMHVRVKLQLDGHSDRITQNWITVTPEVGIDRSEAEKTGIIMHLSTCIVFRCRNATLIYKQIQVQPGLGYVEHNNWDLAWFHCFKVPSFNLLLILFSHH